MALLPFGVRLDGGDGFLGQRLNLDEPLRGEARLDDGFAAVAVAHVVGVVLDAGQEPLLFEVGDDFLARSEAVEARVGAAFGVDVGAVVHHVDGGQMMALAEGEVVGVVRGRDFDRAGAELAADPLVEEDGNFAVHQRQAQLLAVEMQVALVFGMNGDGHVAEHGFGARGGNGEEFAGVFAVVAENGIANLPELALVLFVDHFEVADGGLAARAPVDDVGAAIDEALLVEADEGLAHGDGEVVVHGEVFALPVDGGAEALHLVEDGAAVVALPLPHALDEGFAAQLLAGGAFARPAGARPSSAWRCRRGRCREPRARGRPLMRRQRVRMSISVWLSMWPMCRRPVTLGGGSRMVKADWPSGRLVLDRAAGAGVGCGEEIFADPVFGPVIFNGGGVVGFGQVVRHGFSSASPRRCAANPMIEGLSSEGTTFQVSRWQHC